MIWGMIYVPRAYVYMLYRLKDAVKALGDSSNEMVGRSPLLFGYWFTIPEHWYNLFEAKRTAFRENLLNSPKFAIFETKEARIYGFLYSLCTFEFIPRIAQKRYLRFCNRHLNNLPNENEVSSVHCDLAGILYV